MWSYDQPQVWEVCQIYSYYVALWFDDGLTLDPPCPGTRERHLESLLQSTLRQIVLVNNFPRTLIQIILQITVTPDNEYVNGKLVQAHVVCIFYNSQSRDTKILITAQEPPCPTRSPTDSDPFVALGLASDDRYSHFNVPCHCLRRRPPANRRQSNSPGNRAVPIFPCSSFHISK